MTTIKALAERHCRLLRGAEHRLSDAAVAEGLGALPGWSLEAGVFPTTTARWPT